MEGLIKHWWSILMQRQWKNDLNNPLNLNLKDNSRKLEVLLSTALECGAPEAKDSQIIPPRSQSRIQSQDLHGSVLYVSGRSPSSWRLLFFFCKFHEASHHRLWTELIQCIHLQHGFLGTAWVNEISGKWNNFIATQCFQILLEFWTCELSHCSCVLSLCLRSTWREMGHSFFF